MTRNRSTALILSAALGAAALGHVSVATAQVAVPSPVANAAQEEERARTYFSNLELVDQDGRTVRFFDDVIKDKVVVINFVFTNCDGACPLMTEKLAQVRDALGGYIDAPVRFVSLSIDPARDTPAAMKKFARDHQADHPGWFFLTGKADNLDFIIKRLGQYSPDMESHSTMMLAGNVRSAHWLKIMPYELPPQIAEKLRYLMQDTRLL